MYAEYRFMSVTIMIDSLVNANTATAMAVGVRAGKTLASIKTQDDIAKLTPSIFACASKGGNIVVPQSILTSHVMLDTASDFFTVYVFAAEKHVSVKVRYHVKMTSPF